MFILLGIQVLLQREGLRIWSSLYFSSGSFLTFLNYLKFSRALILLMLCLLIFSKGVSIPHVSSSPCVCVCECTCVCVNRHMSCELRHMKMTPLQRRSECASVNTKTFQLSVISFHVTISLCFTTPNRRNKIGLHVLKFGS